MLHRRPLSATSEYPAQKLVTEAPRWLSFTVPSMANVNERQPKQKGNVGDDGSRYETHSTRIPTCPRYSLRKRADSSFESS